MVRCDDERRSEHAAALRRLAPSDAMAYRELRLEGLGRHPEAFGASFEEEAARPLEWFAERLTRNTVFGALLDGPALMGVAGLLVPDAAKLRHKGVLWGMYLRPAARGTGLAAALVAHVVEHAEVVVEEVQLRVATSNPAAIRLYARAGFRQYGLERRAMRVGDEYFDEALMALQLSQTG